MDAPTFRSLVALAAVTLGVHTLLGADQERRLHPLPELDQNVKTGPAIGSKIPSFGAVDQNGRQQRFETLRGPKGLVLWFCYSFAPRTGDPSARASSSGWNRAERSSRSRDWVLRP